MKRLSEKIAGIAAIALAAAMLGSGIAAAIDNPPGGYIYGETDPWASLELPIDELANVTDRNSAIAVIQLAASGMTDEEKRSAAGIDLITLFAEDAVAQAASTSVNGGSIAVDQSSIQILQRNAGDAKAVAVQTLTSNEIALHREMRADVKFIAGAAETVTITIDPSAASMTADCIRVETPDYMVTIPAATIRADAEDSELVITITAGGFDSALNATAGEAPPVAQPLDGEAAQGEVPRWSMWTKTYSISFSKKLSGNIKISLPPYDGDTVYQAVVDSTGKAVGGKFNPITRMLEAMISSAEALTETYAVEYNIKDFRDIFGKPKEMQDAINILASKGVINGITPTEFSPDGTITRAEIAVLIVRALSKLDENADSGFNDVPEGAWYSGAIGSAKRLGLASGVTETTFAPGLVVQKIQIVSLAARTLRSEMNYKDPEDADSILEVYTDASSIADWGRAEIALATREGLVAKRADDSFGGGETMTRGEAAVVLYRMYNKIW